MRLFAIAHRLAVLALWAGLTVFCAHVLAATLQVGELPTYDNPDPKTVRVPGLHFLAGIGVSVAFLSTPIVFLLTMIRPVLAPLNREMAVLTFLSVLGIVLCFVFGARFGDWFAD